MKFRHIAKKYQETEHIKIYLLIGLILSIFLFYVGTKIWDQIYSDSKISFGVSYSPIYAASLGLNPKTTYLQMFKDLKIKKIRLSAYWDEIEPQIDNFSFTDLDFYINEAAKNNVQVMLSVGYKLPRWPECRTPLWLYGSSKTYRQERQLLYIQKVIERYNNNPTIEAWQIENEPLLEFGTCDAVDEPYLIREVNFVRTLTNKPIVLTDSGELSSWITPMKLSDIFGNTMYRTVENPVFGTLPYVLQPWFYRIKSSLLRTFIAPNNKKTITIELQGEPWSQDFIGDTPISTQLEHFTVQNFKENVIFAKKVGTPEIYLWGVEWWYWIAKLGHPEYLEYARTILN
ncbi:MAG: beta-galactosidase [Candidatus Daviesbacteria bacterium]|nr:beta-galactosidase [Candidatus Daviesbacteria bacterium]